MRRSWALLCGTGVHRTWVAQKRCDLHTQTDWAVLFRNGKTRTLNVLYCTLAFRKSVWRGGNQLFRCLMPGLLLQRIVSISQWAVTILSFSVCLQGRGIWYRRGRSSELQKCEKFQAADNHYIFQYWEIIWHILYRFRRKMFSFQRSYFHGKLSLAVSPINLKQSLRR